MDSEYSKKFGDIFWSVDGYYEIYKSGKEEDLSLIENIELKEKKILADIGGGNGYFSNYIKEKYKFKKVYNVEINPSLSETSQKKYKDIDTINENILNLELEEKVDVILFFNSFFYLTDNHYEKLFYKLKKLLKDDGVILINKNYSSKKEEYPFYKTLKMKLFNIKKYFFSENFNFLTAVNFLFSDFDSNYERSENKLISSIKTNKFSFHYNDDNKFFTIKNS